ncbi:galactokinase [Gulosibacter molinativorax]|uniref:Galactokinase n=1 Tax=Gulosibacter molinativorax TaxID=256821 RepID=A0ABT7C420_9MICO|nr:galactokinase family protein [Gulosibacter molinativorax]MDJ1369982.1 galactokinase [Gulosibacter molinativorax]QUY63828.1 Galactokinase [Gulosibacter molinativorax]
MFRNTSEVAADGFVATFGSAAEGVWSVPGRVSLMGDHTDLEDGLTFGYAHPARSAVAVSRREDRTVRVVTDLATEHIETTLDEIVPQREHSWRDYPLGTIWAAGKHLLENENVDDSPAPTPTGLDLFVTTDLPIGGGLASSASICGAIAMALNDLWGLGLDRIELAEFGYRVENDFIGASTGMSDHVTVLFSEKGKDVFYDSRGQDVSLIDGPNTADEGLLQLLVETGQVHRNWEGVVIDRHQACTRVAKTLGYQYLREAQPEELDNAAELDETDRRRATYVVSEIQRVLDLVRLVRTEGAAATGHLFNESQRSLREEFEATSERIDLTTELALASGALGARMSGSGFGGSVFVLLPKEHEDQFRNSIDAAYAEYGWDAPKVYQISSSEGPRRDA